MARKVKCANCGNQGTNETFFKVPINKEKTRFKYYCNEEEYNQVVQKIKDKENEKALKAEQQKQQAIHDEADKEAYKDLISFVMDDIIEYDSNMIFPTAMVKRIRALRQKFEYKVIKETFAQSKDNIQWAIKNKNFATEWNMVSYVMAIVEGNVNDVYKRFKEIERLEAKIEADSTNLAIQFALDDAERDVQTKPKHVKRKGLHDFLEGEDI